MSASNTKIDVLWSRGRMVALAAVIGMVGAAGSADARHTPTAYHRHHEGETQRETVDQRIASLHASLKITPEQETQWAAVAQVMRSNDVRMRDLVTSTEAARHTAGGRNALDELKTYERFNRAHLDGLKDLLTSFEALYTAMPESQKAVADHVFEQFGRSGMHSNG